MEVNSPDGVHHAKCPIAYPNKAPKIEAIVHVNAYLNALVVAPKTKAINSASGGIGKKDDSAKARIKSATPP